MGTLTPEIIKGMKNIIYRVNEENEFRYAYIAMLEREYQVLLEEESQTEHICDVCGETVKGKAYGPHKKKHKQELQKRLMENVGTGGETNANSNQNDGPKTRIRSGSTSGTPTPTLSPSPIVPKPMRNETKNTTPTPSSEEIFFEPRKRTNENSLGNLDEFDEFMFEEDNEDEEEEVEVVENQKDEMIDEKNEKQEKREIKEIKINDKDEVLKKDFNKREESINKKDNILLDVDVDVDENENKEKNKKQINEEYEQLSQQSNSNSKSNGDCHGLISLTSKLIIVDELYNNNSNEQNEQNEQNEHKEEKMDIEINNN